MRYLLVFAISAMLTAPAMMGLALALAPAPIAAEYWVRQMLVVKREIAREYRGQRKTLVVAGSSGLFSIDTLVLTRELGRPFLNLSFHVNLPLSVLLENAAAASEPGDSVILALEPVYYCRSLPSPWYFRNVIAWQPEVWNSWPLAEKMHALQQLGPAIIAELGLARLFSAVFPASISTRLAALDDTKTLLRYHHSAPPEHFAYSAFHLDGLGNMRGIDTGQQVALSGYDAEAELALCDEPREVLRAFIIERSRAGVATYFANPPFMSAASASPTRIAAAGNRFESQLAQLAPVLDVRADAVFEPRFFFDSGLHLNAEGRRLRTLRLAEAIRRNQISGTPPVTAMRAPET